MLNKYELLIKALKEEPVSYLVTRQIRRIESYLSGRLLDKAERKDLLREVHHFITLYIDQGKFTAEEVKSIRNYTVNGKAGLLFELLLDSRNKNFIEFCTEAGLTASLLYNGIAQGQKKLEELYPAIEYALAIACRASIISLDEYEAVERDEADERLARKFEALMLTKAAGF